MLTVADELATRRLTMPSHDERTTDMSTTTYGTVKGSRYGFTPTDTADYVMVTTKTSNLGLFRIDRFGPDPLTPAGRLRAAAVRHFAGEVA